MGILDHLSLFSYLNGNPELEKLNQDKDLSVSSPEALARLAALSFHEKERKRFFLFPTLGYAEAFYQFLSDYVKEDESYLFPFDEIFKTSAIGVSPERDEERLLSLSSIASPKPSILVGHRSSYQIRIRNQKQYRDSRIDLKQGDRLLLSDLLSKLFKLGYQRRDRVTCPNQMARRGGILDVFDVSYSDPIRREFFGDELDDLRFFKVNDERSFQHVKQITLHTASRRLLSEEEISSGIQQLDYLLNSQEARIDRISFDELKQTIEEVKEEAKRGYLSELHARFYPFFSKEEHSLSDYLSDYECFIFDYKQCKEELEGLKKREKAFFDKSIKDGFSLKGEQRFASACYLDHFHKVDNKEENSFLLRDNAFKAVSYAQSDDRIKAYLQEGYKIRILLPEPNYSNYQNYLHEANIPFTIYPLHSEVRFLEGRLTHGFEIPKEKHVYLSAKEIYGISSQRSRFLSRYKEAKVIRRYEDLEVGDYVVHEVNGVGRYLGVSELNGLEYLKIQYAEDALFYLPLAQYKRIRKYSSREGFTPSLDRLGGSTWSRKKSRIRSKISYLADQLLSLYSERAIRPGFAFPSDPEREEAFRKSFPYPYTESQRKAREDIRLDRESPHPRDRLVAGDVGFGKTEIAFFAAFKCISSHKQAVLLCPTTILSRQHFKVARQRFHDFGVHLALLNRFTSSQEEKHIKEGLKDGKIDFVIGTHALLSDSVVFHDLGLLIIDEEQKFGVAHKEKIKEKAKNVDCLTLTATPIPRTRQMSLLGVRTLSYLTEAPVNRRPVKTYVAKQDKELIKEVIQKELDRQGQVFYLHNKISDIFEVAGKLEKSFPNMNIGVVHARREPEEVEEKRTAFYNKEIDILVCTSIIESGLDIPNVNTIIVENADHFGLSSLYQIKGRVGRSDRLAYAYFFFKDSKNITPDARKRLKALKDFTELGSGYKIARQDLNIRGAGDILGSEQAGFVDSLGYDAYRDLLKEVVSEKKLRKEGVVKENKTDFELSFSLDAHIPSEYGNESQRISMYQELSDCKNDEDLKNFSNKLEDVYGPYPEEVANLLIKRKIEINLNSGIFQSFEEGLGKYCRERTKAFSLKPKAYKKRDGELRPLRVKLHRKVTSDQRFAFALNKTRDYLQDRLFLTEKLCQI